MTSSNEPPLPTSASTSASATASAEPGRHRLSKQLSKQLPKQRVASRGTSVLGVAAMAAVGASGVASGIAAAQGTSPVAMPVAIPVSTQDVSDISGSDVSGIIHPSKTLAPSETPAPALPPALASHGASETLLTRILAQANQQRAAAEAAAREEQRKAAEAAKAAEAKEAAAKKVREEIAKKKAEEQARQQAATQAAAKAAQERLAHLAASYIKPLTSSTLAFGFGETAETTQTASIWPVAHRGQDFVAPSGTPVMAVHSGTITFAGWSGPYGYRVVLTLDDGTQIWYCHLSSIVRMSGKVTTGDVIGRVGASGNAGYAHLHLEVHLASGEPVDPLMWMREHGASSV